MLFDGGLVDYLAQGLDVVSLMFVDNRRLFRLGLPTICICIRIRIGPILNLLLNRPVAVFTDRLLVLKAEVRECLFVLLTLDLLDLDCVCAAFPLDNLMRSPFRMHQMFLLARETQ